VSVGHQALPDVTESEAILGHRSQRQHVDTTELVATAESAMSHLYTYTYTCRYEQ